MFFSFACIGGFAGINSVLLAASSVIKSANIHISGVQLAICSAVQKHLNRADVLK